MTNLRKNGPSGAMVALLAFACGIVVANIYLSQPLVGLMGPAVKLRPEVASMIVSVTQLGYAAGLLLLVPLGDLLENRWLICVTVAACIPALLLAGLAQNGAEMLGAAMLIGATTVAAQMLVPLAAHLAPEERRGQVVGTVMSGLLLGILLARPLASLIADFAGWRTVFFVFAAAMAATALLLRFALPVRRPEATEHYGAVLRSLFSLPLQLPVLRQRAATQAAAFAGFSLFWTGAPLLLSERFHYTQRGIAVFALVGAAGALAAPLAGRLADRGHSAAGTVGAQLSILIAFLAALAGGAAHSVVLLALAGVLLDAGVQTNLVIGQRMIYTLAPEIRSRLNGIFMAIFFVGGAAGSALTSPVLSAYGWPGICGLGVLLALAALGYFVAAGRR